MTETLRRYSLTADATFFAESPQHALLKLADFFEAHALDRAPALEFAGQMFVRPEPVTMPDAYTREQ